MLEKHKKYAENAYYKILLIRKFESRLLELFSSGFLVGTTHTYVGQEAVAVSVLENMLPEDIVFSSHRCHGHYLACGFPPDILLAEIMGKSDGVCGGRGGSQHIHYKNFFSNGVQGSYMPICVGMALAKKMDKKPGIVFAFIGDGTWGEGVVYEAINMASIWSVPLLIIVEDNGYAQTTPKALNTAGHLIHRPKAFNLSTNNIKSSDINTLGPHFNSLIKKIRKSCAPHVEIVETYRFNAHSKGDDHRDETKLNELKEKFDPLNYLDPMLTDDTKFKIEKKVTLQLSKAESFALKSPPANQKSI